MANEKILVTDTEKIILDDDSDSFESEMRELSREELLYKLNYEESDPEKIKIIKKVLKDK